MFDAKDRSADPQFEVLVPRSGDSRAKAAKSFQFAITWTSLTAHLQLREATLAGAAAPNCFAFCGSLTAADVSSAAVPPLILRQETQSDPSTRWEMVVPKMVRGDRVPALLAQQRNEIYMPISIPATSGSHNSLPSSLSRVLAAIGRRTRSLLAGPGNPVDTAPISFPGAPQLAWANGRSSRLQVLQLNAPGFSIPAENQIAKIEDISDRRELREVLLSKVTSTLRSRSENVDLRLAMNHREEPW